MFCEEKEIKLIRINHSDDDNWIDEKWLILKIGELINVNN
jgi:hypothetical protein